MCRAARVEARFAAAAAFASSIWARATCGNPEVGEHIGRRSEDAVDDGHERAHESAQGRHLGGFRVASLAIFANVVGVPARRDGVGRPMGVMLTPRHAPGAP